MSQRGNYSEALGFFEEFVALAPQKPVGYIYLVQVFLATARPTEAAAIFERGLQAARARANDEAVARLESLLTRARG